MNYPFVSSEIRRGLTWSKVATPIKISTQQHAYNKHINTNELPPVNAWFTPCDGFGEIIPSDFADEIRPNCYGNVTDLSGQ